MTVTGFDSGGVTTTKDVHAHGDDARDVQSGHLRGGGKLWRRDNPISVAVGDFNGDGKQDLATANGGSNNVSVLLGNGAGGFSAATNFGAGTGPTQWRWAISTATASKTSPLPTKTQTTCRSCWAMARAVSVPPPTSALGETAPVSVAVGDFNGDGKQDLAVANLQAQTTCRSCWAMARAVLLRPLPSASAMVLSQWRWAISTATASKTSPPPTVQTTCRSCWAMARAVSALPLTSALALLLSQWRWVISTATASKTSPWPTLTQTTSRSCWAMARAVSVPPPTSALA